LQFCYSFDVVSCHRFRRSPYGLLLLALFATLWTPGAQAQSIDDLRTEREEARRAAAEAATEIDELRAEDAELRAAVEALDAHISLQEGRIASAEAAIAEGEAEVAAARQAAAHLGAESDEIRARLQKQAIDAFVAPRQDALDQLNSADPMQSALRQSFLGEIVGDERQLVDRLRVNLAEQAQAEAQALALVAEIQTQRAQLEARLAELEASKAEAEALRSQLQARIDEWQALSDEMEAADAAAAAEIARLEEQLRRQAEDEARRRRDANQPPVNIGDFAVTHRPTPGRITSAFGARVHPIFGTTRNHYGVDIDGDTGDPIKAAASGTVLSSGWMNGYGNTIVISHGGGVSTLYAHQSSLGVSAGDVVEGGEVIGRVGSTGWSTGPHLHFEIRINGTATDPAPFL
jgi:murein DD-endopeptidase MepM/ murein hydrolase activator NlpD